MCKTFQVFSVSFPGSSHISLYSYIVFDPRYLLLTSKECKLVFERYVRDRASGKEMRELREKQ